MPARQVLHPSLRSLSRRAYPLALVGAMVATSVWHPTVRLDLAAAVLAFATGTVTGAVGLVAAALTLVFTGHTHVADLAMLPGVLVATISGRWVLKRPTVELVKPAWYLIRIGALAGMAFAASAVESQVSKGRSVPGSLGQWTFAGLATLSGLLIGAVFVWYPQRSVATTTGFAAALIGVATVTALLLTVLFWIRQDERLLHVTADATAVGVLSSLTNDMNVISAKAATSTDVAFNADTFSELIQSVVYGHETIQAAQLVRLNGDGSATILSELSALGDEFDRSFANWTQGETAALTEVQQSGVLSYTGFSWLPMPNGGEQPYLVYVTPAAVDGAFSGSPNLLVFAVSIPTLIANASAPTQAAAGQAPITLYARTPEGISELWSTAPDWDAQAAVLASTSGVVEEPADTLANRAVASFALNSTEFDLFVQRGVDFGSPLGFRRIVLAAQLLTGLLVLALVTAMGGRSARRETERRTREALLAAALAGSPGWTAIIDDKDRVLMVNREAHGGAAGTPLADIILWSDDADARKKINALMSAARLGEPGSLQHVWSDPNDASHAIRIFEIDIRPLPDPHLVYLQCVDVTEHRDRAMRTAQSERMEAIGVLAGGLAHDFNNLLFITLGYLQMLQRQQLITNDKQANMYVTRAIEAVDRGAVVAKSLLSFARSQPLTAVPLNLREFLENLTPLVEQGLGSAHSLTTTTDAGDALDVVVDPGRLSSSLLNIVFNARDAMDGPGRLEIRVAHATASRSVDTEPEDMVAISVTDTGRGVPPEVLTRAFEPFFTTKKVGSGTGLGLSTVYSFAQQSGGWASMDSTEGVGTTVTIFLPSVHGTTPATTTMQPPLRVATRALVVDDEPALADLVAGWLESFGMEVRVANSPHTALQVADEFKPQLLISDANLADPVDGLELARVLVQREPALLVVFMTGFSDRIKALQRAGVATLAKPFSSEDLRSILTTHLGAGLSHQTHPQGLQ